MSVHDAKAVQFLPMLTAIVDGYDYSSADFRDDEQPITVRITLGDYRRASRLKWELERQE